MPTQKDLSHSFEDSINNMRVNLILAKKGKFYYSKTECPERWMRTTLLRVGSGSLLLGSWISGQRWSISACQALSKCWKTAVREKDITSVMQVTVIVELLEHSNVIAFNILVSSNS